MHHAFVSANSYKVLRTTPNSNRFKKKISIDDKNVCFSIEIEWQKLERNNRMRKITKKKKCQYNQLNKNKTTTPAAATNERKECGKKG